MAVIVNEEGLILSGERSDRPGIWQLPQGGVDEGETAREALFRELREEIGTADLEILVELPDKISYDFPETMTAPIAKKFKGQTQTWFKLRLKSGAQPSLEDSDHEFQDLTWLSAESLLKGVVAWKKKAYEIGFKRLSLT